MDFANLDYERLAKVAFAGAVTAVVADIVHSQFGDEFAGVLTQLQGFVADILKTASDAQQNGTGTSRAPNVGGTS